MYNLGVFGLLIIVISNAYGFDLDDDSGNRIRVIEKYVPLNFLKKKKNGKILGKLCAAVSRKLSLVFK